MSVVSAHVVVRGLNAAFGGCNGTSAHLPVAGPPTVNSVRATPAFGVDATTSTHPAARSRDRTTQLTGLDCEAPPEADPDETARPN